VRHFLAMVRRGAADPRTDAELLLVSGDDAEAFGVFFDRHAGSLLGYFYRRTACAETAAELCAETFAEAFAKRRRYRDTGAPARAWLYTIARRQLARMLRGHQPQVAVLEHQPDRRVPPRVGAVDRAEPQLREPDARAVEVDRVLRLGGERRPGDPGVHAQR
jgi:RNA polymerase sigma-70 factor (ECF subfamily)